MSINYLFVMQAATHLKGLAEKAKLNEKHVRIARIYKAKVATLTSERAELRGRAQHLSEEMERLKSDLKHTSSARARAESREVEVRSSLATTEGELREARSELLALQSELVEFQEGLKSTQGELQLAREELIISRGERRDLQAELRAVTNDLNNKEAQLEAARREVSEGRCCWILLIASTPKPQIHQSGLVRNVMDCAQTSFSKSIWLPRGMR